MAILARRSPSTALAAPSAPVALPVYASTHLRERMWNMLPLSISLLLASFVFWGPFYAPWPYAILSMAFFGYWLVRSYSVAISCWVGLHRIEQWQKTNWLAKYCAWLPGHPEADKWEWPRHMVIIPNYKESEEGLSRTLDSLAAQANANQMVIVMAMEAREADAHVKAERLVSRYRERFHHMFATFHPAGLPNETPGKGSNEAWGAREAYIHLIEERREEISRFTVTSCDADAVFHPRHFEALNYLFLTAKDRYRTFWQPTIFNSNNIWDIPAPLRIPDGLSGINRLSNVILPGSVKFPTSCYSLSWQMLNEVDYWDEEVIPEDWHLYLKCSYTLGDRVNVEPLFLPLGNDCVLTDGYFKTLRAHYAQSLRHAWGASDIPYAWRGARNPNSPLSRKRKLLLASAVTKVHSLWVAQWYLVTLGVLLPSKMAGTWGAPLPRWWTHRYAVPGTGWHPEQIIHPSKWFAFDHGGLLEFTMWLNAAGILVGICIIPLFIMGAVEYRQRGPRPAHISRLRAYTSVAVWPLMAVITFFFASMPALHAQFKLFKGDGLVYRVAEKGSRRVAVPATASAHAEAETMGAVGGGQ
ncbi:MAG: glycosyltransferase family 2 protein [bacterium]